jgi:ubiquinone/menaquinone biosynthesis C-methylase UbiE
MNPWLEIPLEDYEGHMSLPAVGQAGYLADALERVAREHSPASAAIIGCAGGNGFDRLELAKVRRVVGVDINPAYLAEVRRRYLGCFHDLELICEDFTSEACRFDAADLIYAALVFEFADVTAGLASLRRLVRPTGLAAVVLQLPHRAIEAVTPSPFSSIAKLAPVVRLVPPAQFEEAARRAGFGIRSSVRHGLPSGKAFQEVLLDPR